MVCPGSNRFITCLPSGISSSSLNPIQTHVGCVAQRMQNMCSDTCAEINSASASAVACIGNWRCDKGMCIATKDVKSYYIAGESPGSPHHLFKVVLSKARQVQGCSKPTAERTVVALPGVWRV